MDNRPRRVFECLSRLGPETRLMKDYFTLGEKYLEADVDFLGGNICKDELEDTGECESLLLYSDEKTTDGHNIPMYVDILDFELVAVRTSISLN